MLVNLTAALSTSGVIKQKIINHDSACKHHHSEGPVRISITNP